MRLSGTRLPEIPDTALVTWLLIYVLIIKNWLNLGVHNINSIMRMRSCWTRSLSPSSLDECAPYAKKKQKTKTKKKKQKKKTIPKCITVCLADWDRLSYDTYESQINKWIHVQYFMEGRAKKTCHGHMSLYPSLSPLLLQNNYMYR